MYGFIHWYILTNVEFQLKTKSIFMTTDDILRGTSKDVIVFGAIVGFNRLEVDNSNFQGKVILNNLHIFKLLHGVNCLAKLFQLILLRYMQKNHRRRNWEMKVKARITHWSHIEAPMDEQWLDHLNWWLSKLIQLLTRCMQLWWLLQCCSPTSTWACKLYFTNRL